MHWWSEAKKPRKFVPPTASSELRSRPRWPANVIQASNKQNNKIQSHGLSNAWRHIYANLYVDFQLLSIPPSDVRSSKKQQLHSYCTGIRRVFVAIRQSACVTADRDSSVGIAARYGLDGTGIESRRGGEIFHTCPEWRWDSPSLLYNGYRVFPRGKAAGAWRWPPPHLASRLKKE